MYASLSGETWTTEVVGPSAGTNTMSLAFDLDNNPVISYSDGVYYGNLMVAHKRDGAWFSNAVAKGTGGYDGRHSSLGFDPQGVLHVAYTDGKYPASLYYATLNQSSEAWEVSKVDSWCYLGGTATYPALKIDAELKIDAAGKPHVLYLYREMSEDWVMYTTSGDGGTTWTVIAVEGAKTAGHAGGGHALALDHQGFSHMVYYNQTGAALEYASLNGTAWKTEMLYVWSTAIDDSARNEALSSGEIRASIIMDALDIPHIIFSDPFYKVLRYATIDPESKEWTIHVVDDDGDIGTTSSIALDKAGNPAIAYYDNSVHKLLVAHWGL
jgi:hypothetical protein